MHLFTNEGHFDDLDFAATLEFVERASVWVEEAHSKSNKQNRNLNNTNTDKSTGEKRTPGVIAGFKVNKEGRINDDAWKVMTKDEKLKYGAARNKLKKEGVIFPKPTRNTESTIKSQQRTINKLQKQLQGGKDNEKKGRSDKGECNINKLTFAEVLKKMPKDTSDKTLAYVKETCSVSG